MKIRLVRKPDGFKKCLLTLTCIPGWMAFLVSPGYSADPPQPYTNFLGPGRTFEGKVGVTAYKNYESQFGRNVYYEEHIRGLVEPELAHGGHYYVQGPLTPMYSNVIGYANINPSAGFSLDTKGKRNAYICLQVIGNPIYDNGMIKEGVPSPIDMCIRNTGDGTGWSVYSWSPETTLRTAPDEYIGEAGLYKAATTVGFSVDVKVEGGNDIVAGHFNFMKPSGVSIATESVVKKWKQGQFFASTNGKPIVRFGRFMSLVPEEEKGFTDSADGSFMTNARLYGLKVYNRSSYVSFDMSRIDYAWSVQGANIAALSISPSTSPEMDTFSVIHRYNLQ